MINWILPLLIQLTTINKNINANNHWLILHKSYMSSIILYLNRFFSLYFIANVVECATTNDKILYHPLLLPIQSGRVCYLSGPQHHHHCAHCALAPLDNRTWNRNPKSRILPKNRSFDRCQILISLLVSKTRNGRAIRQINNNPLCIVRMLTTTTYRNPNHHSPWLTTYHPAELVCLAVVSLFESIRVCVCVCVDGKEFLKDSPTVPTLPFMLKLFHNRCYLLPCPHEIRAAN